MENESNQTGQAEPQNLRGSSNLGRCLLAATTAVLLVCSVLFSFYPFIPLDIPELGISPRPKDVAKFQAAHHRFWPSNHALAYGCIGLASGICWGLFVATQSRAISAVIAGLSSMVCGAIVGYLTGPFYAKAAIESADRSLVESAMYHSAVWIAVLVPVFFAIGYSQGALPKAINFAISGMVTAVSVAIAYLVCASLIAPGENLANLVPGSSAAKVVWSLAIVLVTGLGGVLAMRPVSTTSRQMKRLVAELARGLMRLS